MRSSNKKGYRQGSHFSTLCKNASFDPGRLGRAGFFVVLFVPSPLDGFSRDTAFDSPAGFEGQRVVGDKNDTANL